MAYMPIETPVNTDEDDDHLYVEDPVGGSAELKLYGVELDDLIDALVRARDTVYVNEGD